MTQPTDEKPRWRVVRSAMTDDMLRAAYYIKNKFDSYHTLKDLPDLWRDVCSASPPFEPDEGMVESHARALCIADGHDPDSDWRVTELETDDWSIMLDVVDDTPELWRSYSKTSRAALKAAFSVGEK